MSDYNCNVIRDLIPSYVDDICSEDTKALVEGHLAKCNECASLVKMMQETDFVSEETEQQEIDYMKKIKQHTAMKSNIQLAILAILFLAGAGIVLLERGAIPVQLYYVVLPVFMLLVSFMSSNYVSCMRSTKWKGILIGVSLCLVIYTIVLQLVVINLGVRDMYPFNLAPWQIGSVLANQMLILSFLHLCILAAGMFITVKTGNSHHLLMSINVIGICLALAFISLQKVEGLSESLQAFSTMQSRSLLVLLAEGILLGGGLWFLQRRNHQKDTI